MTNTTARTRSPQQAALTERTPPDAILPCPDGIPDELKRRHQWVCWRLEFREGKNGKPGNWTKPPINARQTDKHASSIAAETWSTYQAALNAYRAGNGRLKGIGYVFAGDDPFTGIDLDHCRDPDTGQVEPWARDIIKRTKSYAEVSPSGTGVKIFVRGVLPSNAKHRKKIGTGEIELYDSGRYFTVTGMHVEGTPTTIEDRQAELTELCQMLFPAPRAGKALAASAHEAGGLGYDGNDDELLERARQAANGPKFSALYDSGNTSLHGDDESAADLALCDMLAFWCGADAGRIDRLFRGSALYRTKWDERHRRDGATYGAMTIEKALASVREGRSVLQRQPTSVPDLPRFTEEALGLELRVTDAVRSAKRVEAEFAVVIDGEDQAPLKITTSNRSMQDASRELADWIALKRGEERLGRTGRTKVRQFVAKVMGKAKTIFQAVCKRKKAMSPDMPGDARPTIEQIVAQRAPVIESLAFKNRDGTIWSELHERDINRHESERMVSPKLLDECEAARDYPEDRRGKSRPIGLIRQYLPLAWQRALRDLPTEVGSDLAEGTAAARRFEDAIVRLFQFAAHWRRFHSATGDPLGSEMVTLAGLARDKLATLSDPARTRGWLRLHNTIDAWCIAIPAQDEPPACWLGIRHTLGEQVGRSGKLSLPNVTTQRELALIAKRYGLCGLGEPNAPSSWVRIDGKPCKLLVLSKGLCRRILEYHEAGEDVPPPDETGEATNGTLRDERKGSSDRTARNPGLSFFGNER